MFGGVGCDGIEPLNRYEDLLTVCVRIHEQPIKQHAYTVQS